MSSSDSGDSSPAPVGPDPAEPGGPPPGTTQPGSPAPASPEPEAAAAAEVFTARGADDAADAADRVELDAYSGPLDLLLYLIKEHEVDIFDIPVAVILERFVEHLGRIKELDIDRAGEFLLMASTLMEVKSKMLLPAEEIGEIEAEDPRSELVRQLLEYKRFKQAAMKLEEFGEKRKLRYGRLAREAFAAPEPAGEEDASELLEDVNLYHLAAAYEKMMRETMGGGPAQLVYDDVSIEERIEEILALLRERPVRSFRELFTPSAGTEGRLDTVGTFLACLELTRRKLVRVLQAGDAADITLQVRAGEETDDLRPLSLDELEGRIDRPIVLDDREEELVEEGSPEAGVLTRESIALSLRKLGLQEGDIVCVHSSFRALGSVDGGPRAAALAICDAVGEPGTVVMPTFTDWRPGGPPDPESQRIVTGAVAQAFSEIPGAVRDRHFRESYAYRGPRAEELAKVNERRAYPCGSERVMARLAELGGKVLLIGVGYESAVAVVAGEELSRSEHPEPRRSMSHLGIDEFLAHPPEEQEKLHARAVSGAERDYGKVEPTVVSMGIETLGEFGEAEVRLVGARKLIETAAGALDANPDLLVMTKKEVIARRRSGGAGAQKRRHFKGVNRDADLQEIDREEAELRRRVDRALKKADQASERIEAMRAGHFTAKSLEEIGRSPAEGEEAEAIPEGALTREKIADKLRRLGLEEGDIAIVHSSFKSLGPVHGGPLALIAAILDVLGETGNLLMPAFTRYEPGGPADPTLMRAWTGITGLTLSRMAGAVRSRHPLYSWAIYGPRARELATIDNATAFSWGETKVLCRTARLGAKIVLVGVDHGADSTVHLLEELADVPYLRERRDHSHYGLDEFLAMSEEEQLEALARHRTGPKRHLDAIEKHLVEAGVQKRGRLGTAWVRVVRQADLLRAGVEALREDPALLLADEEKLSDQWPTSPPTDDAVARIPVLEVEAGAGGPDGEALPAESDTGEHDTGEPDTTETDTVETGPPAPPE